MARLILIAMLLAALLIVAGCSSGNDKTSSLADCLTEKGVKMYGAYWCGHCSNQKKLFGKSFDYVDYIECDARGNNAQPQLCEAKGIEGFPTWEFPLEDGKTELVSGELSLREIAFRSGYELTVE